jgi:hypothetical protein
VHAGDWQGASARENESSGINKPPALGCLMTQPFSAGKDDEIYSYYFYLLSLHYHLCDRKGREVVPEGVIEVYDSAEGVP